MGQEIAIRVTGEADARLDESDSVQFWGQGANTRYTDTNVYWLTYGGAKGLRITDKASQAGGGESAAFKATVHAEANQFYVPSVPKQSGYDHWFWQRIDAFGGAKGNNITVSTKSLATGTYTATLEVQLGGNVDGVHHLRLYVNGTKVQDDSWSFRTMYRKTVEFPQSYLLEGNNVIRVELANDTAGQTFDQVYIDWLEVKYQRVYAVESDQLIFGGDQTGPWQYRLSGFTGNAIDVFDITDPTKVSSISGATITPESSPYTLVFGDNQGTPRRYVALTSAKRLTPLSITADTSMNLQTPGAGADYLIITHSAFRQEIQPLANHRTAQGNRVQVVDVQDVYDEFGYGLMSAEAIHAFLAYAYNAWPKPAPSDVLLMGDGTYDFRNYKGNSSATYIPPYLEVVDPTLGETATDNRYVTVSPDTVSADILPDMNIGRLPANTPAEATTMVKKITGYEAASTADGWNRNVLFVADDPVGGGGDFYTLSDNIADGSVDGVKLLPKPYKATKIYQGRTCPVENPSAVCHQQIMNSIDVTGTLMISFIGHGTKEYWAEERLMDIAALDNLTNSAKLPVMLPMTCDEGYFIQPDAESFAEASVRARPAVALLRVGRPPATVSARATNIWNKACSCPCSTTEHRSWERRPRKASSIWPRMPRRASMPISSTHSCCSATRRCESRRSRSQNSRTCPW